MRFGNVRLGQWVAAAGGAVLLGSMFLDWYGVVGGNFGFDAFFHPGTAGAAADILLIVACAVPIGGAVLAASSRSLGAPVAASAVTISAGALAAVLVLGRMLLQPGPNQFITLNAWIFVALFAAGAILYGGWIGTKAEPTVPRPRAERAPTAPAAPAPQPSAATPGTSVQTPVQATAPAATVQGAPTTSQAPNQPQRGTKNMDLSNVKTGERIAALGGLVLLIAVVFLNWYSLGGAIGNAAQAIGNITGNTPDTGFSAWDGEGFTGTIANLVILAACIAAVGLPALTAMSRQVSLPVPASTAIGGLGIAAVVMVVLRMLFQPGPNEVINLEYGIFVALVGAVGIAAGGLMAMRDEGTTFGEASDQIRQSSSSAGGPGQPPPPGSPPPGSPPGTGAPPSQGQPPSGGPPPSAGPPT